MKNKNIQKCEICGKTYMIKIRENGLPDDELGIVEIETPLGYEEENLLIACTSCRKIIMDTINSIRKKNKKYK